jgi:fructose-1,6-bisphosphatase
MKDSLTIRIPNQDDDAERKKELKFLDKKIDEYKQTLIYLETPDCRNCLLKDTIDERRKEVTDKFRYYINLKQTLLQRLKDEKDEQTELNDQFQEIINLINNNESDV